RLYSSTSLYPHYLSSFFPTTYDPSIYTLSLHDALPISRSSCARRARPSSPRGACLRLRQTLRCARRTDRIARHQSVRAEARPSRSEEHTSELQSLAYLVCRLLLEKKKNYNYI